VLGRGLENFSTSIPTNEIDLGSAAQLPADYCAGHAMGVTYALGELPSSESLVRDLNAAVKAY